MVTVCAPSAQFGASDMVWDPNIYFMDQLGPMGDSDIAAVLVSRIK